MVGQSYRSVVSPKAIVTSSESEVSSSRRRTPDQDGLIIPAAPFLCSTPTCNLTMRQPRQKSKTKLRRTTLQSTFHGNTLSTSTSMWCFVRALSFLDAAIRKQGARNTHQRYFLFHRGPIKPPLTSPASSHADSATPATSDIR